MKNTTAPGYRGAYYPSIIAKTFSCFIVTGVLEVVGYTLYGENGWRQKNSRGENVDKFQGWKEQNKAIRKKIGLSNDTADYTHINAILAVAYKCRDNFAHPKIFTLEEIGLEKISESDFDISPSGFMENIQPENIKKECDEIVAYCQLLIDESQKLLDSLLTNYDLWQKEYSHIKEPDTASSELGILLISSMTIEADSY